MSQDFWYIEAMCNKSKNLEIHPQVCSHTLTRPRHSYHIRNCSYALQFISLIVRTRIFSLMSTYHDAQLLALSHAPRPFLRNFV